MDWAELLIEINSQDIETATAIASMVVPYGIYIEDYSDLIAGAQEIAHIDLIDKELLDKDRTKALIHIYISPNESPLEALGFLKERFIAENIVFNIKQNNVNEEDWANNWKKYFLPTEIGNKILILPSWEKQPKTSRAVLKIDPGAAFGTGTHESTRLCLTSAENYIKKGDFVLDLGCGSGILLIAALLLGADKAVGVDIDPVAVRVALKNAEINGVNESITVLAGNIITDTALQQEIGTGKYDIIFANIVADVIIALAGVIKTFIKKDGKLIASGIIDERKDEVILVLCEHGFEIIEVNKEKGWISLVAKP